MQWKMKANTIIKGGKPNGHTEMNQHADGQPRRCLEESATLLHGGLDTSRQASKLIPYNDPYLYSSQGWIRDCVKPAPSIHQWMCKWMRVFVPSCSNSYQKYNIATLSTIKCSEFFFPRWNKFFSSSFLMILRNPHGTRIHLKRWLRMVKPPPSIYDETWPKVISILNLEVPRRLTCPGPESNPGLRAWEASTHRVGRVLSFFSSRRNWDSPNATPHPQASVPAPHHPVLGGGAHLLAREGLGESQFRRGDIHCGTLYIYVLCASTSRLKQPLEQLVNSYSEHLHMSSWPRRMIAKNPSKNECKSETWGECSRKNHQWMNVSAKLAWLQSHIVHEDSTKEVQSQPPASQQNVVRHTARVENYLWLLYLSKNK